MRNKYFLGVALLTLGLARPAKASPLFEQMGGFGGMGALQARHAGPSAASTYFNPALLPDAPTGLTAGVLVLNQEIGISVDARPASADVPMVDTSSLRHPNGQLYNTNPLPTESLRNGTSALPRRPRQAAGTGHQTFTYEAVGLVLKLWEDRIAFGLYTLLPNRDFTKLNTYFANEKEQIFSNSLHPELYSDRMTAISVAAALGVRLTKSFSLGAGATIGVKALADANAFVVDATRLEQIDIDIKARARVQLVPQVGFSWKPHKRWHLTGTVHAPQKLDIEAGFKFVLATGSQSGSVLAFTYNFQPWQVGGGVSYDIIQRKDLILKATGSLLYARWSQYIDRQSTRPWGAYEWEDTLAGAAGVRVEKGPINFALDGQYKPTPVPLQSGRTNYVDNDRLGLALAVDYAFSALNLKMKLGLMLQGYRLLERHQTKIETPTFADGVNRTPQLVLDEVPDDAVVNKRPVAGSKGLQTNNPGYPGFSSVGWVTSAGLYLTVLL